MRPRPAGPGHLGDRAEHAALRPEGKIVRAFRIHNEEDECTVCSAYLVDGL